MHAVRGAGMHQRSAAHFAAPSRAASSRADDDIGGEAMNASDRGSANRTAGAAVVVVVESPFQRVEGSPPRSRDVPYCGTV